MDGDDAAVAGDCGAEVWRAVPAIATAARPAADDGAPPLPALAVDSWCADRQAKNQVLVLDRMRSAAVLGCGSPGTIVGFKHVHVPGIADRNKQC